MCLKVTFVLILALSSCLAMVDLLLADEELRNMWKTFEEAQDKCLERFTAKEDQEIPTTITEMILNDMMDIKCFVHCLFEEAGLMKGAQLNTTLFDSWLRFEADLQDKLFDDFKSMKQCVDGVADSDDKCGKAFEYYKCLGNEFFSVLENK